MQVHWTTVLLHAMAYMKQFPDHTKANADVYHMANSKAKVTKIMQQFPEQFQDNMDIDEQENIRCELAGTFFLDNQQEE